MRAVFPSAKTVACHRNGNRLGARTAHRMDDRPGRSPDLRVDALFPPSRTRRGQWHRGKSSPLTVAGAVADLASESGLTAFPRDDLSTGAPRPRCCSIKWAGCQSRRRAMRCRARECDPQRDRHSHDRNSAPPGPAGRSTEREEHEHRVRDDETRNSALQAPTSPRAVAAASLGDCRNRGSDRRRCEPGRIRRQAAADDHLQTRAARESRARSAGVARGLNRPEMGARDGCAPSSVRPSRRLGGSRAAGQPRRTHHGDRAVGIAGDLGRDAAEQ